VSLVCAETSRGWGTSDHDAEYLGPTWTLKARPRPKELQPLMYWAGLSLQRPNSFEYGVKVASHSDGRKRLRKTSMSEAVAIIEDQDKKTSGSC